MLPNYSHIYLLTLINWKETMNKINIIASIVEGETLCDFGLLMEDTEFKNLLKAVINLPLEEATSQLINKANEIS